MAFDTLTSALDMTTWLLPAFGSCFNVCSYRAYDPSDDLPGSTTKYERGQRTLWPFSPSADIFSFRTGRFGPEQHRVVRIMRFALSKLAYTSPVQCRYQVLECSLYTYHSTSLSRIPSSCRPIPQSRPAAVVVIGSVGHRSQRSNDHSHSAELADKIQTVTAFTEVKNTNTVGLF